MYVVTHELTTEISASSFYPGHGDNTHALTHIDYMIPPFNTPAVDDDKAEDDKAAEPAANYPNKFSKNVAKEVS